MGEVSEVARIYPGGAFPSYYQSLPIPLRSAEALEIGFLYGPLTPEAADESGAARDTIAWDPLYLATMDPVTLRLRELRRVDRSGAPPRSEARVESREEVLACVDVLLPAYASSSVTFSEEQVKAAGVLVRKQGPTAASSPIEDIVSHEWHQWLLAVAGSAG
jgi:hypothetical protein